MGENEDNPMEEARGLLPSLDWMARDMITVLDETDGPANVTEIRLRLGIDEVRKLNYRVRDKLVPMELVDVMQPEVESGQAVAKVLTLTGRGKRVAEVLRENEDELDEENQLPLRERIERLETIRNSPFGMWDSNRENEFRLTFELMRVMRDYLAERDGDEFRDYVDENFSLDDQSE